MRAQFIQSAIVFMLVAPAISFASPPKCESLLAKTLSACSEFADTCSMALFTANEKLADAISRKIAAMPEPVPQISNALGTMFIRLVTSPASFQGGMLVEAMLSNPRKFRTYFNLATILNNEHFYMPPSLLNDPVFSFTAEIEGIYKKAGKAELANAIPDWKERGLDVIYIKKARALLYTDELKKLPHEFGGGSLLVVDANSYLVKGWISNRTDGTQGMSYHPFVAAISTN